MTGSERIREIKQATFERFHDLWRRNFLANRNLVQKNPGVRVLKNKFKGTPCIVIGAGPSLDKNIRYLPQAREKAVLIAGDAALKPLIQHGVVPAFVVCLDPQEDIGKFLTGFSHRGMTLVAPSVVHPRVLDIWEGNVVFYHQFAPDIAVLTEIQNDIPHIGPLTPGGTVLSIAYDLAFQIGGNPIIFMGQDLSYPKKNLYSRYSENHEGLLAREFENQPENIVFEKDMNNVELPTLKSMSVSKKWFHWAFSSWKRDFPLEIYNCSEGGILTDHCRLIPLSEAIYKYCDKKINVAWALKKALK